MAKNILYKEFRLVEKSESEVYGAWKGTQLLLFFLAFLFGTICTFSLHMLMSLFGGSCVLFPKTIAFGKHPQDNITEDTFADYLRIAKDMSDLGSEDPHEPHPPEAEMFVWADRNYCGLALYVPLMSSIFGVIWTTIFMMCSTTSLTGLQRPWHLLPWVLMFSLGMGSLCVYTTINAQEGLLDFCNMLNMALGGGRRCTIRVNMVSHIIHKRIKGVFQAILLTIFSGWIHSLCWGLSIVLNIARIVLAVDFHLVKIQAELHGDIEKYLEKYERELRTISPISRRSSAGSEKNISEELISLLFASKQKSIISEMSLEPELRMRLKQGSDDNESDYKDSLADPAVLIYEEPMAEDASTSVSPKVQSKEPTAEKQLPQRKPSLKTKSVQADKKPVALKVHIESQTSVFSPKESEDSFHSLSKTDGSSQTQKKEKQD